MRRRLVQLPFFLAPLKVTQKVKVSCVFLTEGKIEKSNLFCIVEMATRECETQWVGDTPIRKAAEIETSSRTYL